MKDDRITQIAGSHTDITQRVLQEEKLRMFSQVVEQSPVTVVITDLQGRIEYANPKFTETTGYTVEEAIGMNPQILKSGYTSTTEYKDLWNVIREGKEWRGEFYNRRKDGGKLFEAMRQ